MAGMLIRELLARQSVERILILVPPLVLPQWQEELSEKFGEEFKIISRTTLRESGNLNPFDQHDKCLASLYWAMREDVKNYLIRSKFDLIIVDEAHKMAAYTHGVKRRKIQGTKMYQLGEVLLRNAEHCLLLTATPHKGDKENFRHLMNLIDHDLFSNLNTSDSKCDSQEINRSVYYYKDFDVLINRENIKDANALAQYEADMTMLSRIGYEL